ncbi:hypothetical protein ACPA9J_25745 [Pseudomonas aeruginosa]
MLDTLLPVLLFAALALAVLGAAKRFLMWAPRPDPPRSTGSAASCRCRVAT